MKINILICLILFNFGSNSCIQEKPHQINSQEMFTEFIQKQKFNKDSAIIYPGIKDKDLQLFLTKKINRIAETFKFIQNGNNASDELYQLAIKNGLKSFENIYLDTEDRTRIANYIEELMDIVGLKNSNGLLNNFVYGFDPI